MEKKIPMRMCIACKTMKPKKELIRVVKSGEEIFLDKTGRANGRGAYVCNDGECIKKLKKQKLINRAFSVNAPQEVYDKIEESFFGKED
jgi:predicted RNA-binding protein YlxR (DUF448 family)